MTNDYELFLAVVLIHGDTHSYVRLGHFVAWLFDTEGYELLHTIAPVQSAQSSDYDIARRLATMEAKKRNLSLVDAVEQYGTIEQKSIIERLKERVAIIGLKIATNVIRAITRLIRSIA